MPLFVKEDKFESKKNGQFTLRRFFYGDWHLKIQDGEYYSSRYLEKLWKAVLKRCRGKVFPRRVLVLGAGACCILKAIQDFWPEAIIDALDYDEKIIEIGKKIYRDLRYEKINFIIRDASLVKDVAHDKYDLILIDMFVGNCPAPILKDKNFIQGVAELLEKSGVAIVNMATRLSGFDEEIVKAWSKSFPGVTRIRYATNTLIAAELTSLPQDYRSIYQSEFWLLQAEKRGLGVIIQDGANFLINKIAGLAVINAVHTDVEPDAKKIKKNYAHHGVIFWSPLTRKIIGEHWKRLIVSGHPRGSGYSVVGKDYQKKWEGPARRNLKKFESFSIPIKSVGRQQFIQGLFGSNQRSSLKKLFVKILKETDPDQLKCWIAEKNGLAIAGLAVVDSGTTSYHYVAFLTNEGMKTQSATGLIDHWYQDAIKSGLKYLNFGNIYQPGDPLSWRGYSKFKKKFIDGEVFAKQAYFKFF